MGHGLYTAAAGAIARRTQFEINANNLANATTSGFRAQRVTFQEVLKDTHAPNRHLVAVGRTVVSAAQGPLERTHRNLDITLREGGFLVAEGRGGRVLLKTTSAHVAADGTLRDSSQRTLTFAGADTRLDPARDVRLGDHGQVYQEGREVARLLTVDVSDPRALIPVSGGAYLPTEAAGQISPISAATEAGVLEKSNVNPVNSMVRMISLERDFQSLTRVIQAYREADEGVISAGSSR